MTELEHILTSAYKDEMIYFMASHPEYFEEAIALAISDNQPYSWRAAWLLYDCMEENDQRVRKHLEDIVCTIPDRADGHQRELLKILLRMELHEDQEGRLFGVCMTMWEGIHKSPSIRFTAFKFIAKMARKYPELSNELTGLTQDWYLDTLSPGVRRSIARMLRETPISHC
ncbi:MAG: hypothetical protein WC824_01710 [Bacteroidota bacterium]|jgi:hypothetical protein